jgi:hypothetical protein
MCGAILALIVYLFILYRQYAPVVAKVVIAIVILVAGVLLVVFLVNVISSAWSFASDRVTKIRLNRLEVQAHKAEIEEQYPRAARPPAMEVRAYAQTAQLARAPAPGQGREPLVKPVAREAQKGGYEHKKIQPIYYEEVLSQVAEGNILVGIREDQTVRSGVWDDNKTTLILGNSSSGKTTTAVEKSISAVLSGALLVTCDPHAHKEDSLTRRLLPLQDFLYPGTRFGVKHEEIYQNVQVVLQELNRRVAGSKARFKLVLVVDEYNRLMRDEDIAKDLSNIVEVIGQEGRGYNIYGIFLCQQITGNAVLRKSVNSYICHRIDESEAKLVVPLRYARYAPELPSGLAIVKDADGKVEMLQQTIVTEEFIKRVADTYRAQVLAFKSKLQARATRDLRTVQPQPEPRREPQPEPRREPRVTRDFRGMQPEPRREPLPQAPAQPRVNRSVWGVEYIQPEQVYQPEPAPPPGQIEPSEPPRQANIPLPEEVKRQAIAMARAGQSRRKIREATGLTGAKYELLKRLLDSEGL